MTTDGWARRPSQGRCDPAAAPPLAGWQGLLARWSDYLAGSAEDTLPGWVTVPCTAVEALAVNVELGAVLDAERAQLVADVFAGFGTRRIPAPTTVERRNCLALLELWNSWPALAAVWADYKDQRTASAAAAAAAVAGDHILAQHYREAAALITPLAPLDALAVTSAMLDHLGGIRDELADRARCAGVSEGRIDRILRGPRRA